MTTTGSPSRGRGRRGPGGGRRRGAGGMARVGRCAARRPARRGRDPRRGHRRLDRDGAAARDHVHLQPGRLRGRGRSAARRQDVGWSPTRRASGSGGIVEERVVRLADEDLARPRLLGLRRRALARVSPPTTPGMLPTFREIVEELFTAGRIRAVFATETLALGINMPARTVVLERLVEVQRRGPRRHHAGRVHPADRAGRPARHRHRGPRRRAVEPRLDPLAVGRAGLDADLPAAVQLPADLQHGRQPRRARSAASGPARSWRPRSPSSRPTGPSSGS